MKRGGQKVKGPTTVKGKAPQTGEPDHLGNRTVRCYKQGGKKRKWKNATKAVLGLTGFVRGEEKITR